MSNPNKTSTYYCPMHNDVTSSSLGECPICGISLEPLGINKSLGEDDNFGLKWRAALACFLTFPAVILHLFPTKMETIFFLPLLFVLDFLIATIVMLIAGWPILVKGIQSFMTGRLNMFSLVAPAVLIAYFYSVFKFLSNYLFNTSLSEMDTYFEPSAVITTLVLLGQYVEAQAIKKTTRQIENLTMLAPYAANLLLPNGDVRKITTEDIKRGDLIRVGPGEKIPVDGDIKEGQSWVNEANITGETLPVFMRPDSRVLAGTLNGNSAFTMVAKKVGDETVLAGMIQLLASARLSRTLIQKNSDRITSYFIPSVLLIALFTGLFWTFFGPGLSEGIMHAISVLIIASPSALLIAAPLSFAVGMGLGASRGILVKETSALENMEKVTTLILDKTGTLTEGKPMLTKIFARFPFSENEVLKFASSIEKFSDHPVAQSIVAGSRLKQIHLLPNATNFQNIEGKGVIADVEGSRVAVGNSGLLLDLSIDPSALSAQAIQWQKEGLTVSFVALESRAIGLIAVADPIKFTAERAIQQLKREKIKIVMATGEAKEAATAVAKRLNIDEVYSDCLPQDKMSIVQNLQSKGEIVAMAGDGVNDAPAIDQADVGIALSSEIDPSLYNSGITLMKGDLCGVVRARILSKLTVKTAKENLFFALVYNVIAIPLAVGAFHFLFPLHLTPIIACIAMILSSLAIIANSLRLNGHILYD